MLKKCKRLCPECLDCVNHQEKLIFFTSKISVLEVENQKQAAKIIKKVLMRKCGSNSSIS